MVLLVMHVCSGINKYQGTNVRTMAFRLGITAVGYLVLSHSTLSLFVERTATQTIEQWEYPTMQPYQMSFITGYSVGWCRCCAKGANFGTTLRRYEHTNCRRYNSNPC